MGDIKLRRFSEETRTYGAMDYIKGGIKNGLKNIASRAAGHEFKAGIIYIEKTSNSESRSVTFKLKSKDTKTYKNLGEANNEAKKMLNDMKAEGPQYDKVTSKENIPVKVFAGRDKDRYKEDLDNELRKMAASSKWMDAKIKL